MSTLRDPARIAITAALLLAAMPAACTAQETAARWIWYPESAVEEAREQSRWFRHASELPQAPAAATLWLMVDDRQTLWVNGEGPLEPEARDTAAARYELGELLREGPNLLAVEAWNGTSVAGVLARLTATMPDGREIVITSNESWRASREAPEGWNLPGFDDTGWERAQVIGSAFVQPWHEHASFATGHFITDAERVAYERHLATLMAPPEQFADDPPLRAEVGFVNGSAAVTINGEARPLVMYRGTVDLTTEHGRRQVANFREAGVHMYTTHAQIGACWTGPGEYDFGTLDRQIRMFLAADPEAYLIVMVRLVQPSWWTAAHPDELVDYAVPGELGGDEKFRAVRGSMASEAWLRDTGEAWRALIEHVEAQQWGKRVLGYHPAYGISAEWHYFGSWRQQYPDTGAAMTARFREWLRERYGTDAALQAAWAEPEAAIATAEVPGVEERKFGELIAFHDPATERRAMDYYRCHQRVVAEAMEHFGRIVKETTEGAKVCGAYYGYFYGVRPQTQGGHLELQRLFDSPNLDYFVAPYSYSHRLMGQDGRLRSLAAAHRIGGKPHILEADIRTYLHPRNEYGRTEDVTQSVAAITREFSTALIERAGFWWVDFGPDVGGGWFDDPHIMQRAAELQDVAERALKQPRPEVAQVALVCDLESFYGFSDGQGMGIGYRLVEEVGTELYHAGAPFDAIHLDQLAEADLERYRMLIFLNTVMLDADEAALIRRLREAGEHVMVFLWAPGLLTPEGVSVEQAEAVTGIDLELLERWLPAQVDVGESHPLLAGVPRVPAYGMRVSRQIMIEGFGEAGNWYNPRDADTMEEWYRAYEMEAIEGGLRWTFDTRASWTDIHWGAPEPFDPRDGPGLDLALSGDAPGLRFTFVIKDAKMNEFCAAEQLLVAGEPLREGYPLEEFTPAPWSREKPERPALPLRGCKFVLRDTGDIGRCTLEMTNLRALIGTPTTRHVAHYGSGSFAPALVPAAGQRLVAGTIAGTEFPGVLVVGRGGSMTVYSAVPFVPRELLSAAMHEAGVHRYIDEGDEVLRADARFIALHTAEGGRRELRLPRQAAVTNALTGEPLQTGSTITLDLERNSTLLMELTGR